MKTKLCVLTVLLAATFAGAQTNNLTALLQQGLFEEQANRNLDAAIADYQTLAAQFDKDRQLAATATFRLGECYRMQGKTNEAAAEYQRILRDFPDQTTLATLSRQDLTGLGIAPAGTGPALGPAANASDAALWNKVKDLPQAQLENVLPTLIPDATLTQLLQQRDDAQAKLAKLNVLYTTNNPEIKTQEVVLKMINQQIAGRVDGIMQALKLKAELSQPVAAAGAPVDEEAQEIQRIQTMIQNSPDLINAPSEGPHGNLTPLENAAAHGWLKVASFLLDHGADVNAGGGTALFEATEAGNRTMVEFLLAHGADVKAINNSYKRSVLETAVQHGFEAVTKVLLANKADVNTRDSQGNTPLFVAVQLSQTSMVQMLLTAGAEVNVENNKGRTPLSFAADDAGPETVKMLLDAKADPNAGRLDAPLLCAVHNKDAAVAKMLLEAGANPNAKGEVDWRTEFGGRIYESGAECTPMFLAVSTKEFPMVQLLLKFKADPNDSQTDGRPLLFSTLSDTNILEALLDAGADANARMGGFPNLWLLQMAAIQNQPESVALLLQHGAKPNAADSDNNTALHSAAGNLSDESVFALLLENNANPNLRNNEGKTPLDIVKEHAQGNNWLPRFGGPAAQHAYADKLIAFLRRHGALDVLPDWNGIEVSRPSAHFKAQIFQKTTNDWNQFTLFDLLGVQYDLLTASPGGEARSLAVPYGNYAAGNSLSFPDFSRIVIHRPSASGTNWQDLKVNLAQALDSGDCSADVPLKFGDVVEIPETDHVLNERWTGLTTNEMFTLKNCLTRHLQITVSGQTTNLTVAPHVWELIPGSRDYPLSSFGAKMPPEVGLIENEPFMIWPVLENSKLLLSSSDLSHVTVKRRDPTTGKTREWTVDCSNPNSPPNFWLRDGDVIIVPEK